MEAKLIENSAALREVAAELESRGCRQAGIRCTLDGWVGLADHAIRELGGKFLQFRKGGQELLFCLIGFNHALCKRSRDADAERLLGFLKEDAVNKLRTIGADTYLILSLFAAGTAQDTAFDSVDACLEIIFGLSRTAHYVICLCDDTVRPGDSCLFDREKRCFYRMDGGERKVLYYFHELGDVRLYHRPPALDLRSDEGNEWLLHPVPDAADGEGVFLAVPAHTELQRVLPELGGAAPTPFELRNYASDADSDVFRRHEFSSCGAKIFRLSYAQLLTWQKHLNISQMTENIESFVLPDGTEVPLFVYSAEGNYVRGDILNERLSEMIKTREREWALVPDVVLMYPVEVENPERIADNVSAYNSDMILYAHYLNVRLQCETGVPYGHDGADMMERFKNRIEHYYLGEVRCRLTEEMIMDIMDKEDVPVGADLAVQLMAAVDRESNVGVLFVMSLSSAFLLSHLVDNVVRNQLIVIDEGAPRNLYEYILRKWGLAIAGTPKSYITVPAEKDVLEEKQLASLLMSETIYEDGEEFGCVVDRDILSVAGGQYGMALYNIAYVGVSANTYIQFWPTYRGSKQYRLFWNSVAAFYIELVLFEEAAINIFNKSLVSLMSEANKREPEDFLEQNRNITVKYLNTVEFWNVQLNYQSSQKSVRLIRDAFGLQTLMTRMERNHDQVRNIFEINREIVDRKTEREEKESNDEMNFILFILTIVSTFSALYQIIDYIMTYVTEAPVKNLFPAVANLIAAVGLVSIHLIRKRAREQKRQRERRR